eukprot:27153-Eustigmatos_ZCMA.PRE.1
MTKHKREKDVQQMGRALVVKLRAMDAMDKRDRRHQKGGESGQGQSVGGNVGGDVGELSTGGGDKAQPIETGGECTCVQLVQYTCRADCAGGGISGLTSLSDSTMHAGIAAAAAAAARGGVEDDERHRKGLDRIRHEMRERQIDDDLMENLCGGSDLGLDLGRAWHIVKLEDAFKA